MKPCRSLYARPKSFEESNAPRRALDGGATPSSCLVAAVVPVTLAVSHRRAVIGCELTSAASMGTVRRPSGSSSCGVVEDVRLLPRPSSPCPVHVSHVQRSDVHLSGGHVSVSTCPVTGVPVSDMRASGVRVSHVRLRPVGAVVGSWSELLAGQTALGRPGRGRPRTANHAWVATTRVAGHLVGRHSNPPGSSRPGSPVTPGSGGTRPGSPHSRMASLARQGVLYGVARDAELGVDWIRRPRSVVIV
jgi:hypothetical protein